MNLADIIYDPLLDPACTTYSAPSHPHWRGSWIWYPGQLTTHLHAKALHAMVARCCHVSYPGNFHQPVYQLHVRTQTTISYPQTLRWQTTTGRSRVLINGRALDFTRRQFDVTPGVLSLEWVIDFCTSIPSIIVDADECVSDASWQVSLDGVHWVPAETQPGYSQPDLPPDACRDHTVRIPVHTVVQGQVQSGDMITVLPDGEVILDFAYIELARIRLTASGSAPLYVFVGESLQEVMNDNVRMFEQFPLSPLDITDVPITYELPERCVRFVRLRSAAPCDIYDIVLHARIAPVTYVGAFACDDDTVNAIWRAGAATLHACLHDFYLDGLRRDGLPWADQLSEVDGADCVFFDTQAARHSLVSLTFSEQPSAADFGIIDQPMYLPMSFWHDWLHRGDEAFLRLYSQRLWGLLDLYASLQDAEGLIAAQSVYALAPSRDSNWNFFPDWAINSELGPDTRGTPTYAHMQLMRCFEIGAQLAQQIGLGERSARYSQRASQLREVILRRFWDAERQVFINGLDQQGEYDDRVTVHAQVWGILCDLTPADARATVCEHIFEHPRSRPENISLNYHWELKAYTHVGMNERALQRIKHIWGGWLAQGHRRFPEDFRPDMDEAAQLSMYGRPFANSLCHGWSGGAVVAFLSRGVLGITATEPGFRACQVAPQLGSLRWVQGQVPTPQGVIALTWDGQHGELTLPAIRADLVACESTDGRTQLHGPGTFVIQARRT